MNIDMKKSHKVIKMAHKNISASLIIRKDVVKLQQHVPPLANIQKFDNRQHGQECGEIGTPINCW